MHTFRNRLLAGTMAVAMSLSAATPAMAWYRRGCCAGPGPAVGLGILGGIIAGGIIANALRPPPPPPPVYYAPQPQPYYAPPQSAYAPPQPSYAPPRPTYAPPRPTYASRPHVYHPAPATPRSQPVQTASGDPEAIPLVNEGGGTLAVPVRINDQITLNFMIDSGSSDVTIPLDVVRTLMRTGTLKESDFIGPEKYKLADGSISESATFLIRSLKVGNHVLKNVKGSVAEPQADMLLGQSFLSRFNTWSIDNKRQVLVLNAPSDRPRSVPSGGTPTLASAH